MVRTLDFAPLMRTAIGFDHLNRLFDAARHESVESSYPPYNIEKTDEDHYQITMAVAGFKPDELEVVSQENQLFVRGRAEAREEQTEYLYRGIAKRAFERRFDLAETIKVTGANVSDGLLTIQLVREVPEAKKPRTIEIKSGEAAGRVLDHKAA